MGFYFFDKDQRRAKAIAHTQQMSDTFASQIQESTKNTKMYNPQFVLDRHKHPVVAATPSVSLQTMDTVSSIISQYKRNPDCNIAALNFASYKHPGGQFLSGSLAQEESLCHSSYLYNVLEHFEDSYYKFNCQCLNKALYTNHALYIPNVIFQYAGETAAVDIITAAAPNKRAALKYGGVTEEENLAILKDRINFVIDVAEDNDVDIFILGAYGCGVFGQNPREVAQIFKERCSKPSSIESYIFAIPPDGTNYPVFKKILFGGN